MVFNGVFRGLIGSNGNHYGFHGFFHEILMIVVAFYFLHFPGRLRGCSGRQKNGFKGDFHDEMFQ